MSSKVWGDAVWANNVWLLTYEEPTDTGGTYYYYRTGKPKLGVSVKSAEKTEHLTLDKQLELLVANTQYLLQKPEVNNEKVKETEQNDNNKQHSIGGAGRKRLLRRRHKHNRYRR